MYESSDDENINEAEANLADVANEDYERPDYSIGIILTYKAQVDLLQQMINDMNNDAFK